MPEITGLLQKFLLQDVPKRCNYRRDLAQISKNICLSINVDERNVDEKYSRSDFSGLLRASSSLFYQCKYMPTFRISFLIYPFSRLKHKKHSNI